MEVVALGPVAEVAVLARAAAVVAQHAAVAAAGGAEGITMHNAATTLLLTDTCNPEAAMTVNPFRPLHRLRHSLTRMLPVLVAALALTIATAAKAQEIFKTPEDAASALLLWPNPVTSRTRCVKRSAPTARTSCRPAIRSMTPTSAVSSLSL